MTPHRLQSNLHLETIVSNNEQHKVPKQDLIKQHCTVANMLASEFKMTQTKRKHE